MALKTSDSEAVLGCHACHAYLDGHAFGDHYEKIFENALGRTHNYWRYKGYDFE